MSKNSPESNLALTEGVHHVGLTVRNIKHCVAFFENYLGYKKVGGRPDYPSIFISDGQSLLTLWQAKDPAHCRDFDRHHQIGLHHLALKVRDTKTFLSLHQQLKRDPEIQFDFEPEPLGETGLKHMMLYVPGGPRLELVSA